MLGPELLSGCWLRQPSGIDAQQRNVLKVRLDHSGDSTQVLVESILKWGRARLVHSRPFCNAIVAEDLVPSYRPP